MVGLSGLGLTLIGLGLLPASAWAIPGQSLRSAETWIQANPTLNPSPGERFFNSATDYPGPPIYL